MSTASREDQRDRLLEAALVHVPFDGWSRRSLSAGARDLGVEPGLARRLFPRGGDDLLAQLERWADRQMLARVDADALAAMRIRERIAHARAGAPRGAGPAPRGDAARRSPRGCCRAMPWPAAPACGGPSI